MLSRFSQIFAQRSLKAEQGRWGLPAVPFENTAGHPAALAGFLFLPVAGIQRVQLTTKQVRCHWNESIGSVPGTRRQSINNDITSRAIVAQLPPAMGRTHAASSLKCSPVALLDLNFWCHSIRTHPGCYVWPCIAASDGRLITLPAVGGSPPPQPSRRHYALPLLVAWSPGRPPVSRLSSGRASRSDITCDWESQRVSQAPALLLLGHFRATPGQARAPLWYSSAAGDADPTACSILLNVREY